MHLVEVSLCTWIPQGRAASSRASNVRSRAIERTLETCNLDAVREPGSSTVLDEEGAMVDGTASSNLEAAKELVPEPISAPR